MRVFGLALVLSASLLISFGAGAQPVPPAADAIGAAVELPPFDLSVEPVDLQRQLSLHRERLASAEGQLRANATDPTLRVLVDQLQFRIALLEIILDPIPAAEQEPAARTAQLASIQQDRDTLASLTERGKSQGIGSTNQSVLESRLADLDRLIEELRLPVAPPTSPGVPAPPPGDPARPTTPPDPTPAPADPVAPASAARTPPHLTLGDLMSTLNNLPTRIDEVRRLGQQIDPSHVFVIPVSSLFPGNGNGPTRRAIDRGYFSDLYALLAGSPVLSSALAASGFSVTDSIGIFADGAGNVMIFVDR